MPEGNILHRLARRHSKDFAGRIVRVSSPQGRFAAEAARLDGRRFRRAEAHGKHLFHFWQGGLIVHVHLGMAGEFYRFTGEPPVPRPSVRMRLQTRATPEVTVDLIGPPTCELIGEPKLRTILERLGPDPLRADSDSDRVWTELRRRSRPIGDALLDQKVIAGVGNIFRNEALFLAGIHPLRRSDRLARAEWEDLWETTGRIMRRGLKPGALTTVEPGERARPASGSLERDAFYVYERERCRRCGGAIREFPLSGRRMWVCRSCQPYRRVKKRSGALRAEALGLSPRGAVPRESRRRRPISPERP